MKWLLLMFAVLLGPGVTAAEPESEIEALLLFVSRLEGAQFVRNGDAHDAKTAESHLRLKWKHQAKKIRGAEDFVRLCATKSSISGKPYLIRYASGREVPAAEVLLEELRRIRAGPSTE